MEGSFIYGGFVIWYAWTIQKSLGSTKKFLFVLISMTGQVHKITQCLIVKKT